MKIQTTRFGELQIKKNDLLSFPEGILGFEHLKRFFIVDPNDQTLILWLQSYDDGAVAFPIIEPRIFRPDYVIKLLPNEMNSITLESMVDARVYCILTIPQEITLMTANLKAPIVINSKNNTARQIVLQDNKLPVCFEMYKKLKQYIVSYSSDDTKREGIEANSLESEIEVSHSPAEESWEANKMPSLEKSAPLN